MRPPALTRSPIRLPLRKAVGLTSKDLLGFGGACTFSRCPLCGADPVLGLAVIEIVRGVIEWAWKSGRKTT